MVGTGGIRRADGRFSDSAYIHVAAPLGNERSLATDTNEIPSQISIRTLFELKVASVLRICATHEMTISREPAF